MIKKCFYFLYLFIKLILIAFFIPLLNKFLNCFIKIKPNRILFCSKRGLSISCNPKYIYDYIRNLPEGKDYEYIWVLRNPNVIRQIPNNTRIIKYNSIIFLYYLLTSKIIIHNDGSFRFWYPSEKQLFIETWHGGGAYKRATIPFHSLNIFERMLMRYSYPKSRTLIISSSRYFTKYFIEGDYHYFDKLLNCGQPRNDIFFKSIEKEKIDDIKIKLNIGLKTKILLYAPTWKAREGVASNKIDFERLIKTLNMRFNSDWIVLQRAHAIQKIENTNKVLDVSDYPDMQELLLIADILISDYSSCIWDFSLTRKPCILFCPDLKDYLNNFNFYIDISEWGFSIVKNNEELNSILSKLDLKEQELKMINHNIKYGSYEKGDATQTIWKYMKDFINKY